MFVQPLLAKSYDFKKYGDQPPDYALLTHHSRDVATACDALAKVVGPQCLRNADLPQESIANLTQSLILNGWIQDIGKANSHFQGMLKGTSLRQLIRHEALSSLLFWTLPEIKEWLSPLPQTTKVAAIWGAAGHHRKFDKYRDSEDLPDSLTVHLTHPDIKTILSELGQSLGLGEPPSFTEPLTLKHRSCEKHILPASSTMKTMKDDFTELELLFELPHDRRFLALVKALGIAADVCASALAKEFKWSNSYSTADFIGNALGSIGMVVSDFDAIIQKRLGNSVVTRGNDTRREFQFRVAQSPATLTLALAGCGTGKSVAAYEWGKKWCQHATDEGRKNFRFYFCLPTTGTTTEHFKDYALESGIDPSLTSLTHSRADVDLRTMSGTIDDEDLEDKSGISSAAEACLIAAKDKIDSLALWSTPLVVTTTDTVLGAMSNSRRALYSFPAMMNGAVVFDECHAFDDVLFGNLLVFVKNFPNLPVLLMTASLPKERREALLKVRTDLKCINGPPEFEQLRRYNIEYDALSTEEILERIRSCISERGKVLWVRNRVDWANKAYRECCEAFGGLAYVDVYHSRLKYKHRSDRHRRVIDKFNDATASAILIATQVAEMSLDLSADLLITDNASIPAIIQRMGRLNRKSAPEKPLSAKTAVVIPVNDTESAPYTSADLRNAKDWIQSLRKIGKPLNQEELSDLFESAGNSHEYDVAQAEESANFFAGLWQTGPAPIRKEGYTMSVILKEDFDKCDSFRFGEPTPEWVRRHEVAIPIKDRMLKWKERIGYIPVAPAAEVIYRYDEISNRGTGAEWKY